MKKQIIKFVSIAFLSLFITSCNSSSTKNINNSESDSISKSNSEKKELTTKLETGSEIKTDSSELTALMRNLYKWHEIDDKKSKLHDFPTTTKDSIFTGIDWVAHKERMTELEKTNFFSKEFLDTYNNIADSIDSFIKISKESYDPHLMPTFVSGADDWCGYQWSPDNYWETIIVTNLNVFKDSATFKWDWIPSRGKDLYSTKAKKENNVWKVSFLEGFKQRSYSEYLVKK
jgi:hypothetical protein